MAAVIFNDQENGDVASALLARERVKLPSAGKPLGKSHQSKVLGSVCGEKPSRKALGNVNKQVTTQRSVQPLKDHKAKKPVPASRKVVQTSLKPDKQHYPDIEKFVPYNPEDYETFAVPEEHKLSHLCLAGVGLLVNVADAKYFDALLGLEPAPMDIPALSWGTDAASLLATMEEITVEMPPMLQC